MDLSHQRTADDIWKAMVESNSILCISNITLRLVSFILAHSLASHSSSAAMGDPKNKLFRALYDFAGAEEGDLPFKAGDIVLLTEEPEPDDKWWYVR